MTPLDQWLHERPERREPHVDFGCRWIHRDQPRRYHRVSWIPTTGELYLTDSVGSYVRALSVIPTREQVHAVLAGWATVCSRPYAPVDWIESRIGRERGRGPEARLVPALSR